MNIMEFKRICPNCGKELTYKSETSYKNAVKSNSVCRSCASKERQKDNHCADLTNLLSDTPEAFYWIGFLLADGSFYDNRLKLGLSPKDSEHLYKFAKFINYHGAVNITSKSISIACKNNEVVDAIKKKFDIKDRKTYNPPETISRFREDLVYSLLAGFIDGDGNIQNQTRRKDFFLRIKTHASWKHILKEFNRLISDKDFVKIDSRGYALLTISNTEKLKQLKSKILSLNIPILSRKWNVIDLNYTSKYVAASELREKVIEAHRAGIRNKDIAEKFNTSKSNVTKILKTYGEYIQEC